jgi:hypothetical protein
MIPVSKNLSDGIRVNLNWAISSGKHLGCRDFLLFTAQCRYIYMTKISLSAAFAALLISTAASAADHAVCSGLAQLAAQVKDCQQNSFYVRAADACLTKLESDISAQQALLSAAMLLSNATADSSQSARMANSAQDLGQMQSTLTSLENEAQQAASEIKNYSVNFKYAGPISQAFAARFHMDKFLGKFPCFANSQAMLTDDLKKISQHVAELDGARQTAAKMAAVNGVNQKKLDASSLSATAHGRGTASYSSAPARAGTPSGSASSITGTEKIQADKAAEQKLLK